MQLNFLRKDSNPGVSIVIISASCCMPGMEVFDQQAQRVVQQAITETGVEAQVKMMPATTAYFGGVPRKVMAELINLAQSGRLPAPAVLINGKAVSYGVPELKALKSALREAAHTHTQITQEDQPNESPA